LHDLRIVEERIEAEQAELEAAAAVLRAVARPCVQPAFVRIGTISRLKLTSVSAVAFLTSTCTVAFCPPNSTAILA
jgi:hypothetical protein